jgi:ribosomal protein S18 acetylase RimI-like enzyme
MERNPIKLGELTQNNVGQLKVLNSVIFPVKYSSSFYKSVFEQPEAFTRLAYYGDPLVGAVCCREDPPSKGQTKKQLYIMTLGVLAPYRKLKVGKALLDYVLTEILPKNTQIGSVYLHVQVNNEAALAFYQSFGFEIVETHEGYYSRIDPSDAYVLRLNAPLPEQPSKST